MSQFSLRKKPRISYYELDEPNFDEYVFCVECCDYVLEYCSIHGPLLVVPDNKVPATFPSCVPRAALTIPVVLHLARSTIPDAGIGVFTTIHIPMNVRFGPYTGAIVQNIASNYCWQIHDNNNKPSHVVDASDANNSNWMRYVNCSRHFSEQNLIAFQYRGEIYYRTTRIIPRFTELAVFYGADFARKLNVDLRKYNKTLPLHTENFQEHKTVRIEKEQTEVIEVNNNNANTKAVRSNKENIGINECNKGKRVIKDKLKLKQSGAKNSRGNKKPKIKAKPNNNACIVKEDLASIGNNEKCLIKNTEMKMEKGKEKIATIEMNNKENINVKEETIVDNKMFACDKCKFKGLMYFRTSHNQMHYLDNAGVEVFKCDICYLICREKASLEAHRKCHESIFCCNICDKAFTNKSNLTIHTRIHTGEKLYKCVICDKAFKQKSHLTIHTRIHTGVKPYKCVICAKAFTHKSGLTIHTRIHTGEKPYICIICDKAFKQKSELTIHTRIHTGEKPYKCVICDKAFTLKSKLTIHTRIHTGEKPYICVICAKAFTHKSGLTIHTRIHTDDKPLL